MNFRAEVCVKARNKRKRTKNSYTERKTEECFQRKTIGSCSRRDACGFLHRHTTGTVRITWNEVEIRKKFSPWAKHPLQYRKWKTQTDGKSLNSLTASPTTGAENSLSMSGKMKNIVVWLSTSSRVSWLQVLKHMHWGHPLPMSTSWWQEQPQREVEKKVLKEQLLSWDKKKSPRLCISRLTSNEFYSTESWRIEIERFGGTHLNSLDASWYKIEFGKEEGNLEAVSKKVNLTTSRLYQQSSVEFGEKICKLNPNIKLRFIVLWRRQRHRSAYVYCVFGCFNAQCWARKIELRYNGYFEKVQKPHMRLTATRDSANKGVSTSFCPWSRSVRNSAITRWNASDSIAS